MAWHDHGNPSEDPIFWLDGLDIPVVLLPRRLFRRAPRARTSSPSPGPTGDSDARYGANLLPVDHKGGNGSSPVFNYPFDRTRDALERMRRHGRVGRRATA